MSVPADGPAAYASIIAAARVALAAADGLVVSAGAGMGVDSGLPDFRGDEGFWKAYPPFAKLGLGFTSLANPRWFRSDPALAWGFYGHRLELYRATVPHDGFTRLRELGARLPLGVAVFTSNVDGQFQKAGFDPASVCEAHGSIHHLQCLAGCGRVDMIWPATAETVHVDVDPDTMRAREPWPRCRCGSLARPNVLMFGDGEWRPERTALQERALRAWLERAQGRRVVVVELGAGLAVPTVRGFSEHVQRVFGATLVRVNPREPHGPRGTLSLPLGARAAVEALTAS